MVSAASLLLADGRFPAGGHAVSGGVEAAVRYGDVTDVATLERYLRERLATTGVVEASFAAASCDATPARLDALAVELDARILSPRLRDVSRRLGRQLVRAARAAWPDERFDHLTSPDRPAPHQCVVLGVAVAASGGSAADAALLALHHLASSIASAGVRLLALDPLAVVRVQAAATSLVDELAASADRWALAEPALLPALGGALTEILGEDHGHWDARLFVA